MSSAPAPTAEPFDSRVLIAELRPALVSYFERRCGNVSEAEDLAQETIARALAHAGWTSMDRARGYIFRIGVNLWRDRRRRRLVRGVSVDFDDPTTHGITEDRSPERVVGGEEELRCIAIALTELHPRTRDVFVLHRLEQMKQAEIAGLFDISVSSVEKHIARALEHLATRLEGKDMP
jgi:RNA polymerase sigma factor (sigma-70 family)